MVFRRALAIRPVRGVKHIVDTATAAVTAVVSTVPVIVSVDDPGNLNPTQVATASTVSAIFLRVEVIGTGTFSGVPRIYMAVYKDPGNNMGNPDPNSVGDDDRRRFVFHQEMTMLQNVADSTFPRTMFQGVIRIPPRFKRFGINDQLRILFQHGVGETTAVSNLCVQCIYKEFR